MKFALIIATFTSFSAFASINEVTGTFKIESDHVETESTRELAFGSFEVQSPSRMPASVSQEVENKDTSVTELTGTFN